MNVSGETSEATAWEAHKAYIRSILMIVGSEEKRRKEKDKLALQKEIKDLEQQHKKTRDGEVLARLFRKREVMRVLIEQETRKLYNLVKKERYLGGNRSGKFLAKVLRKKKNTNYIDKIETRTGDIRYKNKDITLTFGGLYAINKNDTQEGREQKREKIKNYVKDIGLAKITEIEQSTLEAPITEDEVRNALKETPVGKSPGPDGLSVLYYKKYQDNLIPKMLHE